MYTESEISYTHTMRIFKFWNIFFSHMITSSIGYSLFATFVYLQESRIIILTLIVSVPLSMIFGYATEGIGRFLWQKFFKNDRMRLLQLAFIFLVNIGMGFATHF